MKGKTVRLPNAGLDANCRVQKATKVWHLRCEAVRARNDEHGYAILEADADLPYLEPFRSTARSSAGVEIKLVLETIIHLGGKWATEFNDDSPAFVPIQRPPLLSLNRRYLYFGTGFMGDTGVVVTRNGELLGLHIGSVEDLRERLNEMKALEGLDESAKEAIDAVAFGCLPKNCEVAIPISAFVN
jgi:hypothetical protein